MHYNELNRLETVTIDWLNPKPVTTYHYDDAGRLDYLVNFNGTITDYSYDNANRLTALDNKKSDNTTILASYSFTLDANGNRTNVVQNEPLTPTPNPANVSYGYNTKKNRLLTKKNKGSGTDMRQNIELHKHFFKKNLKKVCPENVKRSIWKQLV
jgi:uncharacterized protein RhaS with RHS repeats